MKIFLFLLVCSIGLQGQNYVLHCGHLIDCTDESVKEKYSVVISEGTIEKVSPGFMNAPEGYEVVDLSDHYVMPGFMDMHVHIESESGPKRYLERFTQNPADIALKASMYARKTLLAGFTTVRDLGGSGANVSLRNAINAGYVDGPRIYTTEKSLASTGGHADPTNGVRDDLKGDPGPKDGVVNSVEDARKAVRQRYKNGADLVKITATGGVLSVAKDGSGPQFTQDVIEAIVETARDYNMTTAAHAHGKEGMKRAVVAGITSIEHGTLMDKEVMELMKKHGTYYVPTISAGKFVAEKAKIPGFYPAIIVPKAIAIGAQIQETFAEAYKNGVTICFGTDTGVSYHGDNAKEFEYMVEAGMPSIEAIRSATYTPAKMLGLLDEAGTIQSGKWADLVAVKKNPLDDITSLQAIDFVMKSGKIYKD